MLMMILSGVRLCAWHASTVRKNLRQSRRKRFGPRTLFRIGRNQTTQARCAYLQRPSPARHLTHEHIITARVISSHEWASHHTNEMNRNLERRSITISPARHGTSHHCPSPPLSSLLGRKCAATRRQTQGTCAEVTWICLNTMPNVGLVSLKQSPARLVSLNTMA